MSVYVDDADSPLGRMRMCHMIADSREELLDMVRRLGVHERYIQKAGTPEEHFDIAKNKRETAIRYGAIPISNKALIRKIRDRR